MEDPSRSLAARRDEIGQDILGYLARARNWKTRGGSLLMGLDLADAQEWNAQRNQTTTWAQHYADEEALADVLAFIEASKEQEKLPGDQALVRIQRELEVAKHIQQQLMPAAIPQVPYATVKAYSRPCSEIGGDFFDVIPTENGLTLLVVDVSGKGVPAAVLASTIQGMLFALLTSRRPLAEAITLNEYLCQRDVGKYATLVAIHLPPDGELEILNAGSVEPFSFPRHGSIASLQQSSSRIT